MRVWQTDLFDDYRLFVLDAVRNGVHTMPEINRYVKEHLKDARISVNDVYTRLIVKYWVENKNLIAVKHKVPGRATIAYYPGPEMLEEEIDTDGWDQR